jgi:putative cell wall-binding protein
VWPTLTWNEAVTGVSDSSVRLLDASGTPIPASVWYDPGTRRATIAPSRLLEGGQHFTITASSAIRDAFGNAMVTGWWGFDTGRVVNRLAGPDRYATAAEVSKSRFTPGTPVVYVASGANFPDALAAGPAAALRNGPVLLVTGSRIPEPTASELTRLRPGRIVVVGSAGVVSDAVVSALRSFTAGGVTRVAGPDRYATAAAISADAFSPGVGVAYITAGANFPDALAGGAAAAAQGGPVLLTRGGELPAATASELARLRPARIVVLGSAGVISDAVLGALRAYSSNVSRLAGPDRYATAVAISQATKPGGSSVVYLATGTNFPDGLAGNPVAGLRGAPLLLVPPNRLPVEVAAELVRLSPSTVIVLGSTGVVTQEVANAVYSLWP